MCSEMSAQCMLNVAGPISLVLLALSCLQTVLPRVEAVSTATKAGAEAVFAAAASAEDLAAMAGDAVAGGAAAGAAELIHCQPHRRIRKLIDRLLRELTVHEKLSLMSTSSPAINRSDSSGRRLWVQPFAWWAECGHGAVVTDQQDATIFPQVGWHARLGTWVLAGGCAMHCRKAVAEIAYPPVST